MKSGSVISHAPAFFILYSIGLRSLRQLLRLNNYLTILHNQADYLPRCNRTCHEGIRQGVIDVALDSAAQWSRTILLIEALAQQQVFYLVADDQFDLLFDESTLHLCQEQVNNAVEFLLAKSMEDYNLVNAVDELWSEHAL